MLEVYGSSDRGNVRENNEDRICYPRADTTSPPPKPEAGQLFIVADGVGGMQAGEHASRLTVEILKRLYYYGDHTQDPRRLLQRAIGAANEEVLKLTQRDPALHGAASTVTAAVVRGNQLYVANVGDSRTYLIQADGRCQQLTKDHSLTQQKIDRGLIRPEQAKIDPDSHIITRSIGLDPGVDVDIFPAPTQPPFALLPGDAILLCSDGLTDLVQDDEIARVVARQAPKQAVHNLIKIAKRNGGHDNISAVIGRMPGGAAPARVVGLSNRWRWFALACVLISGLLFWWWPRVQPQLSIFAPVATPALLTTSQAMPTATTAAALAAPALPSPAVTQASEPTATRISTREVATDIPVLATPTPVIAAAPIGTPIPTFPATAMPAVSTAPVAPPELVGPEPNFSVSEKTTFAWKWPGELQANQGFQIIMQPVGANIKSGVHDAKDTIALQPDQAGVYHLSVDLAPILANGDYEWTVAVVWLNAYRVIAESQARPIKINIARGEPGPEGKPTNKPPGAATRRPSGK